MKEETGISGLTRKLAFSRGDLVYKAGDFGASVYRVVAGTVDTLEEDAGMEIILETFEPGDVFGEMVFASRGTGVRDASARASDAAIFEAWHVQGLLTELENAPPVLKLMIEQNCSRLVRSARLIERLKARRASQPGPAAGVNQADEKTRTASMPWSTQRRRHYRKSVDEVCKYRPSKAENRSGLIGQLVDISVGGAGMEISERNMKLPGHQKGDRIMVDVILPGGKDIHFEAEIVNVKASGKPGVMVAGLSIRDIGYESQKRLGFFLMP